ncbi:hypothetical protein AVDCRST_MAG94-6664, partial [uncultured Leptolyngbya sp.]
VPVGAALQPGARQALPFGFAVAYGGKPSCSAASPPLPAPYQRLSSEWTKPTSKL